MFQKRNISINSQQNYLNKLNTATKSYQKRYFITKFVIIVFITVFVKIFLSGVVIKQLSYNCYYDAIQLRIQLICQQESTNGSTTQLDIELSVKTAMKLYSILCFEEANEIVGYPKLILDLLFFKDIWYISSDLRFFQR